MRPTLNGILRALLVAGLLATPAAAQMTGPGLTRPAVVPLDFLRRSGKDAEWLGAELARMGFGAVVAMTKEGLEVQTLPALKAVNRIRAFAYLAAQSLKSPYLDLVVVPPGEAPVRCVTLFPANIVPSITAMDFSRESFPAAPTDAAPTDAALLDQRRVDPARQKEYAALDREAFRERYFDANGNLRDGLSSLNSDTGFIATAFDHGFFVMQGDLTGIVQLDRE